MMTHHAEHDSILSDSLNTVDGEVPTEPHIPRSTAPKRRKVVCILAGVLGVFIVAGLVLGVSIWLRSRKVVAKASPTNPFEDPGIKQSLSVSQQDSSGGLRQLSNIPHFRCGENLRIVKKRNSTVKWSI